MAAKAADLPPEKVIVHNHLIGGGFGRRLEADGAVRAVEIARHVDGPVKVVWTREEDIQHDMYRPYWYDRLSAGLDEQSRPVAWKNRFAGSSCAVDCGTVVNPNTVQAQIQSGIIFGATAALYGEITLKDGRVEQSNFDTYQMLRMNEAPAIEVYIVKSAEPPGGMGETGTSAIVPAIANAIFAATGKRLRKMPVDAGVLKQPG